MKTLLSFFLVILLSINIYGQELPTEFKIIPVNKNISEFQDKIDLSSPLNSYLSFKYIILNGKQNLYRSVNSDRIKAYLPKTNTSDLEVSEKAKDKILKTAIKEVIIYKDSVACVLSEYVDSLYIISYLSLENDKWVSAGEDLGNGIADSRNIFLEKSSTFLAYAKKIKVLNTVSTDTLSFINYLNENGQEPKVFVLQALEKHKLVIFGEYHKRLNSWELCKEVLNDPIFSKSTGTIFLEVSAHCQKSLDTFLANENIDRELLLDIFCEIQINGWSDKGMYEFIVDVWKLNKSLPDDQKIKLITVDILRPFSQFKTSDDLEHHFDTVGDRNEFMAQTVKNYITSKSDTRNSLFIVGVSHVMRSTIPGLASGVKRSIVPKPSAGSILSSEFPTGDVFTIFTHFPIMNNGGLIFGKIRNGIFDYSFNKNGNKPIAFNLKNSPFGNEPFDAFPEVSYKTNTGSYADNYDAYIFLGALESEPSEYILYDIFSEDFVVELSRRANISDANVEDWFDIEEVSAQAIITQLQLENEGKMRWEEF